MKLELILYFVSIIKTRVNLSSLYNISFLITQKLFFVCTRMEVTFSLEAFSKIILHVTKYPHNSVNGILLKRQEKGKRSTAGSHSSSSDTSNDNNLGAGDSVEKLQVLKHSFHEVIPVLHMSKYVTPMMELALAQVKILNFIKVVIYSCNHNLTI